MPHFIVYSLNLLYFSRDSMDSALLKAIKTSYDFINKTDVISNDVSDELMTTNEELVWQQLHYQNKKLFKKIKNMKVSCDFTRIMFQADYEQDIEGLDEVDFNEDEEDVSDEEIDDEAGEEEAEIDEEEEEDLFNLR